MDVFLKDSVASLNLIWKQRLQYTTESRRIIHTAIRNWKTYKQPARNLCLFLSTWSMSYPLTFCQPIRNLPHYPSRGTLTISLTLNGFYTLFQCFHCWLYTNKYRLGCDQPSNNFNKMDLINTANTYKCWSYAFRGSGLIFILTTRDRQISHEKK